MQYALPGGLIAAPNTGGTYATPDGLVTVPATDDPPTMYAAPLVGYKSSDGLRHSDANRWNAVSPFNMSVNTGLFRTRTPSGSFPDYGTAEISVIGSVYSPITIVNKSGQPANALVDSDSFRISTQGHRAQLRMTASGTTGAAVLQTVTVNGVDYVWTVRTVESTVTGAGWDPTPLPPGYNEIVLTPAIVNGPAGANRLIGDGFTGNLPANFVDVRGKNVITFTGGEYNPTIIEGVAGDDDDNPVIIRNDPTSTKPVVFRRGTGTEGYAINVKSCAHVVIDGLYKWSMTGAWVGNTLYIVGQIVVNDSGKRYICTTRGTSAASGGPTGTTTGITDGGVTWNYLASTTGVTHGIRVEGKNAAGAIYYPAQFVTYSKLTTNVITRGVRINGYWAEGVNERGAGFRLGDQDQAPTVAVPYRDNCGWEYCWSEGTQIEGFYIGRNYGVADPNAPGTWLKNIPLRNPWIRNCVSMNCGYDGMEIKFALDVDGPGQNWAEISGCTIINTGRFNLQDDNQNGGLNFFTCGTNLRAFNNIIIECGGYGVSTNNNAEYSQGTLDPNNSYWYDDLVGDANTVDWYNNLVIRAGKTHIAGKPRAYGINLQGIISGGTVYQNTVVDAEQGVITASTGTVDNVVCRDNFSIGCGRAHNISGTNTSVNNENVTGAYTEANYFTAYTAPGAGTTPTAYATVVAWDFTPVNTAQTQAATIGQGTAGTGPAEDIAGNVRGNPPDIGAYEYTP